MIYRITEKQIVGLVLRLVTPLVSPFVEMARLNAALSGFGRAGMLQCQSVNIENSPICEI